ncbi:MAG: hypothetical protein LUD22_04270, partial [Coprobacillus sp.]|nr:hypothetical protein [Coprobacillus sp.]
MKKTKLLTSIAALALVLGLGACTEPEEEETTTTDDETTGESTSDGDTTGEPTAYAVVGDFVDSNWDNEPATDSKYFIPAGTEEFKVTVTTASEPVDNEWWTDDNQWDAG